jgi:hypothetical protein
VIGTTHYKVAGELISEMLVAGVPEKQKMAKLEATMRTMADLLSVVESLELLLFMEARACSGGASRFRRQCSCWCVASCGDKKRTGKSAGATRGQK